MYIFEELHAGVHARAHTRTRTHTHTHTHTQNMVVGTWIQDDIKLHQQYKIKKKLKRTLAGLCIKIMKPVQFSD
jgi:hypothetical protein